MWCSTDQSNNLSKGMPHLGKGLMHALRLEGVNLQQNQDLGEALYHALIQARYIVLETGMCNLACDLLVGTY
jgi:hypothetical protein